MSAQAGLDPSRTLALLHIPKSSGTALRRGLVDALGIEQPCVGFDRSAFGAFGDFATFAPSMRAQLFTGPEAMPREARFVSGHFALTTLERAYPGAQVISFLREPATRLLSHWMYWRSFSEKRLRSRGAWGDYVRRSRGPLHAFLADPELACATDNIVTRMLLWPEARIPAAGFIEPGADPDLIARARAALARLSHVDVVENPAWLDELQRWIGRSFAVTRTNVTRPPRRRQTTSLSSELSTATMALVDARTRIDRLLWRSVVSQRMAGTDPESLRLATVARAVARYAQLAAQPRGPRAVWLRLTASRPPGEGAAPRCG